ncbi:hypothetical protein KY366_04510, partial [Candidatus Woesearchaeota archaeon]|nr:hypothetical protein [Candidatus Woesearchaeota archaeon]
MNRLKNTSKEKEKLLKEIKDISRSISNHKKEQRREIYLKARPFIPIMIVMLFVVFSMFTSLIPTGLVAVERQFNYSDSIGLAVNNSQAYTWSMGDYGSLSSVKLDGSITKRGSARVYLEYGNNSYTVFDSLRLGEDGIGYITGSVVYDDTNQSVLENDTGETTGSESNSAGEKTIDAAVLGGGSKAEDEVFELNVESSFSWDVDYDKLCTRWSLTSSNSLILPT